MGWMLGKEIQEINSLPTTGFTLMRFSLGGRSFGRTWTTTVLGKLGMGHPVLRSVSPGLPFTLRPIEHRLQYPRYSKYLERYIATLS